MSAQEKTFDLVVIGSGPGGYVAAIRASQLGMSCAIVEKEARVGGTCLNIGCIPSKALLDSSERYLSLREELPQHGILTGEVRLDLARMMSRKEEVVRRLTDGVRQLLEANGVSLVHGTARLAGEGSVAVRLADGEERTLAAGRILLATGSVPAALPAFPVGRDGFVDSTGALSLSEVPARLVVIGGGAIGLELGSVWSRLGSRVTVVELMPQILPGWDEELAQLAARTLERQGLVIHTGARMTGYRDGEDGEVVLEGRDAEGHPLELSADRVLVAVGRRPYAEGLGLPEAGVESDEQGRVKVDQEFRTTRDGIYAIGDLIRGAMLAHKAEEEGIAAVEIMAGRAGEVSYTTIPAVVYTWPEVASVGATEEALKGSGVDYRTGTFPFRVNGRALGMGVTDGKVKILADRRSDRILGVHIIGPWASDLIAEAVTVMEFGGSAEDIARTVHAHPTLSEVVREAALDVDGRAIHLGPRRRKT